MTPGAPSSTTNSSTTKTSATTKRWPPKKTPPIDLTPSRLDSGATSPLTDLVNARDFGGTLVKGGQVRSGFVICTDDLSFVSPEEAVSLVAEGLTAVIDLRSREEVAVSGRGPLADYPVSYHYLPMMASLGAAQQYDRVFTNASQFGRDYADLFERSAPSLVMAISIITLSPGTAAFHCTTGNDRTGVLSTAILLTLRASDSEIIAGVPLDGGAMAQMLGVLRERHGDPLLVLRAAGLSGGMISRLRARGVATEDVTTEEVTTKNGQE